MYKYIHITQIIYCFSNVCPFVLQYLNHRNFSAQAETCAVHLYAKIGLFSTITLQGLSQLVEVSRHVTSATSLRQRI